LDQEIRKEFVVFATSPFPKSKKGAGGFSRGIKDWFVFDYDFHVGLLR